MELKKSLNIIGELNAQSLAKLENKKEFRKKTKELCEEGKEINFWYDEETLQEINPVKHTFIGGCYIRELFMPKDQLAVTKIHKQDNPFFIMKGSLSFLNEDGWLHIKAPYHGLTKVGTQRIMYIHEDTVFITVHSTDSKTIKDAESKIFAEDFNDPVITEEDLNTLKNNI
tara:strand:+ start:53 stop:565 length:513 start_codon:yes stop_codon:yes gene_type:complete